MIDAINVIDAIDANDLIDMTDVIDVLMRRRSVQSARPHPVGSDTGHFSPNRSHCQRHFLHGRAVAAS